MYTLYYFDQYSWRYKPSKIHQNPGFIAAAIPVQVAQNIVQNVYRNSLSYIYILMSQGVNSRYVRFDECIIT